MELFELKTVNILPPKWILYTVQPKVTVLGYAPAHLRTNIWRVTNPANPSIAKKKLHGDDWVQLILKVVSLNFVQKPFITPIHAVAPIHSLAYEPCPAVDCLSVCRLSVLPSARPSSGFVYAKRSTHWIYSFVCHWFTHSFIHSFTHPVTQSFVFKWWLSRMMSGYKSPCHKSPANFQIVNRFIVFSMRQQQHQHRQQHMTYRCLSLNILSTDSFIYPYSNIPIQSFLSASVMYIIQLIWDAEKHVCLWYRHNKEINAF